MQLLAINVLSEGYALGETLLQAQYFSRKKTGYTGSISQRQKGMQSAVHCKPFTFLDYQMAGLQLYTSGQALRFCWSSQEALFWK